jgi:hypothetical protein
MDNICRSSALFGITACFGLISIHWLAALLFLAPDADLDACQYWPCNNQDGPASCSDIQGVANSTSGRSCSCGPTQTYSETRGCMGELSALCLLVFASLQHCGAVQHHYNSKHSFNHQQHRSATAIVQLTAQVYH